MSVSSTAALLLVPATAVAAPHRAAPRRSTAHVITRAAQPTCPQGTVSEPFAQWGDTSTYQLIPDGDFESSGATFAGGAARVAGSEPYAATGVLGQWSVSLPAGGSVTSPSMCLDASEPTLRFFTQGSGNVLVQIVDNGVSIPVGTVSAASRWQPSPVVVTGAPMLGPQSGGTAQVSVRLTALSGNPRVDDVFIDPWNRG
ncbi:MAG: hypothetical protein ABSH51_08240 [Solirubrobacteraceae bacterium]|jgi:hypothetical protein